MGHEAEAAVMNRDTFYLKEEHHVENGSMLGFWLYLMNDSLIFAILFACYGVLGGNYDGGPGPAELFDLNLIAVNTGLLLISSITFGFVMIAMQNKNVKQMQFWFAITGLLGAGFIGIELYEFNHLIHVDAGPDRSAFLSSFFALVGCHGLHVTFGIIWLMTMMVQVSKRGIDAVVWRRVSCLSLFWHFLDVVWIGVFTFVYLMGVLR